jgi:hypothetical protein
MDFLKSFGSAAGIVIGLYAGYKTVVVLEKYFDARSKEATAKQTAPTQAA